MEWVENIRAKRFGVILLRGRVHEFLPFFTVFKIYIKLLFLKLC